MEAAVLVTPTLVRAAEAMLRGGLEPMLASRAAHRQMEVASQVGPCKEMWHMQHSLLSFRQPCGDCMSLPCNSRLCKFQCGTLRRSICCCAAVRLVCTVGWRDNLQRQLSEYLAAEAHKIAHCVWECCNAA